MPPRINLNVNDVREKMQTVKTHIELSELFNCGTDVMRKYLLETGLYEEFCKIRGQPIKCELGKCCICNSTDRVSSFNGKQYCKKHFNHMYRYGKIIEKTIFDKNDFNDLGDGTTQIILRNKYQKIIGYCIIDSEDYDKVINYKWYMSHGYCKTKGVNKYSGVSIQNVILGDTDNLYVYDHQNHKPLDNRKCNLRISSDQENAMNMGMKITNSSGVTGVVLYRPNSIIHKWSAVITYQYKSIYLGRYTNFDDAVIKRLKGEAQYFKEYSPNYNRDTHTIILEYISKSDGIKRFVEVDLEGNILKNDMLIAS